MSAATATCGPSTTTTTSMPSMRGCASPRCCLRPRSPRWGTSSARFEPLVSAGRDVISTPMAGGRSGTCESAADAARIVAGEGHAGHVEVVDSQTGGQPRLPRRGCRGRGRARRRGKRRGRCRAPRPRAPRDPVLPRHPGRPARGRSHRSGTGDAGNGAKSQANPDLRHRDHAGRPGPTKAPGVGANGCVPG
jgi:hypothetical protein